MPHCASSAALGLGVEKKIFKINTVTSDGTFSSCMVSHSCTTAWMFVPFCRTAEHTHSFGNC